MYQKNIIGRTSINRYVAVAGETIEQKMDRIVNNSEPINDGAPIIYTERKDGVPAGYDIRTDRFDIAVEGMDKVHRSAIARREEAGKNRGDDNEPDATIGGAEPTQDTQ